MGMFWELFHSVIDAENREDVGQNEELIVILEIYCDDIESIPIIN